ncbi:hypothetical protein [Pararhizobium sp. A13]|uniref:hypothetical protein n=1 Tax=Pararhizobium sp. A13 TaxID=3133975 RepID=UPI00324BFEE9
MATIVRLKNVVHAGALVLLLPALCSCSFFDPKIVKVCEAVLQQRLRSPSGYERIEIVSSETKMDREAFSKHVGRIDLPTSYFTSKMQAFDSGRLRPMVFTLLISYDAPNAYGTPVRGIASCEYVGSYTDDSHASEYTVSLDGQTQTQWLIERIKAASN